MYLENFIRELQDFGEKDYKVFIEVYACGETYKVPMTLERLRYDFEEGKVTIVADDN